MTNSFSPVHASMRVLASTLAAVGFAAALPARAWGPDGHQTVGRLADQLLVGTPAAAQVRRIIGMKLERASLWADCAKGVSEGSRPAYQVNARFVECRPFETKAEKKRFEAYVKRNLNDCSRQPGEESCHRQYHYADVAIQHPHYAHGLVGTSNHDIVAAINAAVIVLRGGLSPEPIHIESKREALLLLAHYVGDIHQPLHVEAVYLDPQGQVVDPDAGGFDPATRTIGGNSLLDGSQNLHHEWDEVGAPLKPDRLGVEGVDEARAVAPTPGELTTWSAQWADDTIAAGAPAFAGVGFGQEDTRKHWNVSLPQGYGAERSTVQRAQLIKAGARLAQLLQAIWP